jgi:hypothetical protein
MEFKKFFHLFVRRKVTAEGVVDAFLDGGSLIVRKTINACAPRLDLARHICEFLLVLFRPGLNFFQQCLGSGIHTANMAYLACCANPVFAIGMAVASRHPHIQ